MAVQDPGFALAQAVNRARDARAMEWSIRQFLEPDAGRRLLDRVLKKRNKPGESEAASITWGEASNFELNEDKLPGLQIRGGNGDQPADDGTADAQTLTFTETARTTTTVRVENPSDSAQWVEVQRIDTITFVGDDKVYRKFVLRWS